MGAEIESRCQPRNGGSGLLFLTEDRATNDFVAPETFVEKLRGLLMRFRRRRSRKLPPNSPQSTRLSIAPSNRCFSTAVARGRVALIGDAVHATTPHLAAGACIGIEDAMVLAEELAKGADLSAALGAFEDRRWDRCRMVVENSGRLADIEIHGGSREEHASIMQQSMKSLAQAI